MSLQLIFRFKNPLDMFTIFILFALISFGFTSDITKNDFLSNKLHSAALEVISLHRSSNTLIESTDEELSEQQTEDIEDDILRSKRTVPSFFNIPILHNSTDFMHSYKSDTGAGNREDLIIEQIREERLAMNELSPMKGWRYVRFNSTDFVMAFGDNHLNVWRMSLSSDINGRGIEFDRRSAYCALDMRSEGRITNAMFYDKMTKYNEVLFFAITIESLNGNQLRAYEVVSRQCLSVFQLNFHRNRPLRIGFVSSQYESALVVLFSTSGGTTELKYPQKSRDESTKVVEVYVKNAIDLETFTLNGFGFIAVANRLGCEVYRMDELLGNHLQFDNINIRDIVDIKAFRLGFKHFLGLATNTSTQYLYVWHSWKLHPMQEFKVESVLQWNTIYMPTCRDDVLIYLIRNGTGGQLYRWNGQRREFQLTINVETEQLSRNYQVMPYSISDFSFNHTAYVLQVDTKRRAHLVSIGTRLEVVPDPELMRGHKISEVMHNLKERFVFQLSYLQKIANELKYAIRPHSNRLVVTPNLIRNLTALNGISVSHIKSLKNIFWQNSKLTPNDLKHSFKSLVNIINGIEQQIATLIQITSDVVLRNKPSVITGQKRFVGHIEMQFLNTTSVTIDSVNRLNLPQIMDNLYRKSRPQIVRGVKHIVKQTFVKHSINSGLINGIDFNKQIVTTNSPQTIKGFVTFNSQLSVTNDLIIRGKLNNYDLDNDLVYLNRPEVVLAPKAFIAPLIAHKVDCLTVDGIDLLKLLPNVLLISGLQTINSKLIFTKPFNTQNIWINGMVNNIGISEMAHQLVYKNRPVGVEGKKAFILDDIHINNLIVGKRLDGRKVPEDLLLRTRDQVITAPKVFEGNTRFDGKVMVNGFVNGLRLPQDIVTLTRNETIFGPIVFEQSIVANQDIDAHRLVDGVDISELRLYSLKLNDRLIESDVRFNKPVIVGAMDVSEDINGVNLGFMFREAVFKDSVSVEITGSKWFDSHIRFDKLSTERLNGVDLTDLMTTNKNETIFSSKVFSDLIAFNSMDVKGLIGSVNIESLYNNRISLSKPQTIDGIKNFVNKLVVKEWLSVGAINNIVPQLEFVLKSKPQLINGTKIFAKTLNANKLIARNPTLVKGRIAKILINDLNSGVIRLNSHQTVPLTIRLIRSNSTFVEVFKDLNELNIRQFADNVMSVSKPQTVFAPKLFKSEQTFSRILSNKGISGIYLSYLKANAVHLNGMSRIEAPFTFVQSVFFNKSIGVDGVVNGVNLSYLKGDAVYKTGHNLITGNNVFKSGFRVNGDIHALTFNGMDLWDHLLTNTRDHTIRKRVKFTKSVKINGNLLVEGWVNGHDLSEFDKRVVKMNSRNVINGNLELIGETKVLDKMNIKGRVNGINLTQLFDNAVYINSNQDIAGVKTMTAPIELLGHLNTTYMNEQHMPQLLEDIVFINSQKEQHILAPKTFTDDITSNGLIQSKGIAIMASINGLNLVKLDSEVVKVNRPTVLRGVLNFKDLAIITNNLTQILGPINGINLLRDVILLHFKDSNSPQVITGSKAFQHLVLNESAIIDGLVNGLSLKALELNTFLTFNKQRIMGHKIVNGLVEFGSNHNNVQLLNGMRIPEDLVTLRDDQTLSANLIFNNRLFVGNVLVKGTISGHNLTQLASESLVKDRPQVLSQPIKFDSIVFRRDVMVEQHVDNVDLSALSNNVKQFTRDVNISKDHLIAKANRHHYASDYLYKSLEKSVFEIDLFDLYQTLDEIHFNRIDVLTNDVLALRETTEFPQTVHSIRFNPKIEIFETLRIKQNPHIIQKPFILNGEEFVIHLSPYFANFSSYVTKSGQMFANIGHFVQSVEVLNTNPNTVLLVSFQSNTGKVLIHSIERILENKYMFSPITESVVGIDTQKVIAFQKGNEVYIVVAKHYGLNCVLHSTETLVLLLRENRILELVQKIPLMNVADVVHFANNGKHYLALSDGTDIKSSLNRQTIYVYRSEQMRQKCGFSLFQKLEFDNVLQLSAFTYGTTHLGHQYLVAMNASNVMIWKQFGESGFTHNWSLQTKSARVVKPTVELNDLYLIVGQSYKCHESLVFRAQTRGITVAPISFRSNYN